MPFIWFVGGHPHEPVKPPPPRSRRIKSIAPSVHARGVSSKKSRSQEQLEAAFEKTGATTTGQKRNPAILARQIMSSPVYTLPASASQKEAEELMKEREFHHVPLLSENQELVAIVSDRDLFKARSSAPDALLGDIGTAPVLTVTPDTPIRECTHIMMEDRFSALPVVSPEGKLLGMLTRSDILRCVTNHAPLDLWV